MPGGGGYPGGGTTRGGGGYPGRGGQAPAANMPSEPADLTLAITQSPTGIKIERKWTRDGNEQTVVQNFSFDGSESRNRDDLGRGELSTKGKWHKRTLVIDGSEQVLVGSRDVDMHFKEEFSLSKDGKALTVKKTRQLPAGLVTVKQTFRKS